MYEVKDRSALSYQNQKGMEIHEGSTNTPFITGGLESIYISSAMIKVSEQDTFDLTKKPSLPNPKSIKVMTLSKLGRVGCLLAESILSPAEELEVLRQQSTSDLIILTLESNQQRANEILIERISQNRLNQIIQNWNLKSTRIDPYEISYTTSQDLYNFLQKFINNYILSPKNTNALFSYLHRQLLYGTKTLTGAKHDLDYNYLHQAGFVKYYDDYKYKPFVAMTRERQAPTFLDPFSQKERLEKLIDRVILNSEAANLPTFR